MATLASVQSRLPSEQQPPLTLLAQPATVLSALDEFSERPLNRASSITSAATPPTVWGSWANSCRSSSTDNFTFHAKESFDGHWVHKDNLGISEFIRGDILYGPDGTVKKLSFTGENRVSLVLHGQTFEARLSGDSLVWSDGDIWIRRVSKEKGHFEGRWAHERRPKLIETIEAGRLRTPSGEVHQLSFHEGGSSLSLEAGGRRYSAELIGDRLVWDDGDVWARLQSPRELDGTWVHKSNPSLVEVIKNGTLCGPDRTVKKVISRGGGRFAILLHGRPFQAQLAGDQLLWSDGDTWLRKRPQQETCVTM